MGQTPIPMTCIAIIGKGIYLKVAKIILTLEKNKYPYPHIIQMSQILVKSIKVPSKSATLYRWTSTFEYSW